MSDSFWTDEDGKEIGSTDSFELEGGNLAPMPDGTQVKAVIDEAKWDSKDECKFISLRWSVLQPEQYKNRKVFQKLWVLGNNPQQSDHDKAKKQGAKARRMLSAIDGNAGGNLVSGGGAPTEQALQKNLIAKPMVIKLAVWEMRDSMSGDVMTGNWVQAVFAKTAEIITPAASAQKRPPSGNQGVSSMALEDDEIPF